MIECLCFFFLLREVLQADPLSCCIGIDTFIFLVGNVKIVHNYDVHNFQNKMNEIGSNIYY